jgi:hypothetical protein
VIEEIRRAGFYKATLSNKNVKEGIDKIKSMEVFIHIESVNLWREYRMYSWRTYKNMILDEPIKENDDAMDALRYSVYSHNRKVKGVPFFIG